MCIRDSFSKDDIKDDIEDDRTITQKISSLEKTNKMKGWDDKDDKDDIFPTFQKSNKPDWEVWEM